jgi:biopolymer transport protein ExbD/biopolymer transport protein TolR
MNRLKRNNLARLNTAWSMVLLVVATTMSAVPRSSAQAMQKGIRVELARTNSAVAVPDADNQDALIVTVTESGKLYFGIDPVTVESLVGKLKDRASRRTIYVKADARAPYASVVKVFDAARTAEVAGVTLLTTQPKPTSAGAVVLPQGIEMELSRGAPAAEK